jgi:dihydropteroate synthase-like protein
MSERVLFLTGRLARSRLERVLGQIQRPNFEWTIVDIGVKVAALMTQGIIVRRLPRPVEATRVVVPGRCRADLETLSREFGVCFERGPDELNDLPVFLGAKARKVDLSRHDLRIFAEIVDASVLSVDEILTRAILMVESGADVIDLGCLPDSPFPHLEDSVRELRSAGLRVSVDSADPRELTRGARAGADFLLSLNEATLDIASESGTTAVLIPATHGDLGSLLRASEIAERKGTACILDPILDPIHFGFAASLTRYAELRRRAPDAEILMGTGNLTELTDADSGGLTALLLGICSELRIRNALVVHVSPHTRRTIEEHDAARRMLFAAREDSSLPRNYGAALLQLHDRRPFPNSTAEIEELAGQVKDLNFRIETASDGIHVYNSAGRHFARDAFSLFPKLGVEGDAAHAFYLGAELMKAEIAWRLGKRYVQDDPLDWGAAVSREREDLTRLKRVGHTLRRNEAED